MITHVAICFRGKTWALPTPPNRHHHVIALIYKETGTPVDNDVQGFLTDKGSFLDRKVALIHARDCGQLRDPDNTRGDILFSEDLWFTPPVPDGDQN